MNEPTPKMLAASVTALLIACTAAREETRPAPAPDAAPPAPAPRVEPPSTPDAPFRATQPQALPVTPSFEPPVPVERKLKNGAVVLVTENHALPLVAIDLVIRTGVNGDPIQKAGLAGYTAAMLDEGTRTRRSLEIAAALEDLAAEMSSSAGLEASRVHLNCLTDTLPRALEIMADVVQNPAFREEDMERVRRLLLTALEQKRGTPGALAGDQVARLAYGDKHPWGQPEGGTPETIKGITRADLAKFHDTWFRPNNAIISVSGDVTPEAIVALLERHFGTWKARALPKLALPPLPSLTSRSIVLVDKPGTSQSQLWVVGRLFPASSPDAVPMRVANYALGGLFTSRLNLNLREDKGYSYGVFSRVSLMRETGLLTVSGGIIAQHTAEALGEYEKELQRFARGDITGEELARAKEAYIRALPSVMETNDAVSSLLSTLPVLGLPLDYYRALPGKVKAVTLDDANRVASRYVRPDQWPAVVVGPGAQFEPKLKGLELGPVDRRPTP